MPLNIALIGSNSFLARHILEALPGGHRITVYGIAPPEGHPEAAFQPFSWPEKPLDFTGLAAADVIIYAAGAGIQPGSAESPELIYELNAHLPIRMITALAAAGYSGQIITFGSYFELGDVRNEHFATEEEVASASGAVTGHYAASKRLLTRFLASAQGLPKHHHFILPNIYGKGEHPNRLIPYLMRSVREGTEIRVTSGSQVRQYLHVTDAARAVVQAIENDYPSGLYNLCNREPVRVKELIRKVLRTMDREDLFEHVRFGDDSRHDTAMPFLLLENSKMEKILRFVPSVALSDGIARYL